MMVGWFLFVACIAAAYTAGLTASMLTSELQTSADLWIDVSDMVKTGTEFGTIAGGSSAMFFRK